jgi:hypothetical protein
MSEPRSRAHRFYRTKEAASVDVRVQTGNTLARLTFYLPLELQAAIQRDAAEKGQTLSVWMRRAAEAALKQEAK